VTVRSRTPDPLPDYIPLVVIRRTGGSSDSPTFYDTPWINVQCWAAQTDTMDAFRAAHNLADDVRRVLWEAWANQTVTAAGWIRRVRESSAPKRSTTRTCRCSAGTPRPTNCGSAGPRRPSPGGLS
jgi:hypothetical protein